MAGRRAVTEGPLYDNFEDEDGMPIDLNNLTEEELKALALAYGQNPEEDEDSDQEDDENAQREADSDIDNVDFQNFKGMYFNEDPNRKY